MFPSALLYNFKDLVAKEISRNLNKSAGCGYNEAIIRYRKYRGRPLNVRVHVNISLPHPQLRPLSLPGICLAIGILSFPAGWDNDHVRGICGPHSADYGLGDCGVRWAFVLAVIAFFDCWILGILAFTLAHR